MNNDIINTIPNGIEDTNLNSNEIRDMVQDDKSIVEIHEFDSSQVTFLFYFMRRIIIFLLYVKYFTYLRKVTTS